MQIIKNFFLKTAISSLLVLSTMSMAETQYVGNTPFVSGQALKKVSSGITIKSRLRMKKNNRNSL